MSRLKWLASEQGDRWSSPSTFSDQLVWIIRKKRRGLYALSCWSFKAMLGGPLGEYATLDRAKRAAWRRDRQ